MKKMRTLLGIVLAVVMLLTSTVAVAESIPTYGIELKDMKMSVNGETQLDLTGLRLQLSAGTDEYMSNAAVSAELFGGDAKAASALIATTEDGRLVASVDGMSKPVYLDVASLMTEENMAKLYEQLMSMFSDSERAGLEKIYGAIMAMSDPETMAQYETGYADYQNAIMGLLMSAMTAEEGVAYEFVMGEGEQTASVVTINMTGEILAAVMQEAVKFYDNQPVILDLMNGMMLLEGGEEITSYGEILDEETINQICSEFDIIVTVYANDDGSLMDIDVSIYDDIAAEEPYFYGGALLAYGMAEEMELLCVLMDDVGTEVYIGFGMYPSETMPGEVEYAAYIEATEDGETTPLLSAWVGPDAELGTLGSIVLMPESEYDSCGFAWSYGETGAAINYYDSYQDVVIGVDLAAEGLQPGEAKLYMDMESYGELISLETVAKMITGEIDTAAIEQLANAEGIDITTITDDQTNAITQELSFTLMGAMGVLGQNVPGLAALLGF